MSVSVDVAVIVQDEEEIIHLLLRACETLHPYLRSVVIVDGGSKDGTIDVIDSWRDRLPIDLVGHPFDNFCYQRNRALERCTADFIIKGDADLTWSANLKDKLPSLKNDPATFFDCLVYFCVIDAYHSWRSAPGYATVLWKNVGARYVRPIHEYLVWPGDENPKDRLSMVRHDWESIRHSGRLRCINDTPFFDNSLRKSNEALRNRAKRYARWGKLSGEAGIPLPTDDDEWCVRNKEKLLSDGRYERMPEWVCQLVIDGA